MPTTPVGDRTITKQAQGKLAGRGLGAPCRVTVDTKNGQVTLSGTVQNENQKGTATQAMQSISGVRRVVNNLTIKVLKKY